MRCASLLETVKGAVTPDKRDQRQLGIWRIPQDWGLDAFLLG